MTQAAALPQISSEVAGLSAATSAAVLWAISTFLYSRAGARMTAPWLNFTKGAIASIALIITIAALGKPLLGPLRWQPLESIILLGLSGLVGIAIGDTGYFASMRAIGARNAALLYLLAVPAASAGGLLFLGERLPPLAWLGIAVTFAGVMWVVSERQNGAGEQRPRRLAAGVALGMLAAVCQAAGALMTRSVVRDGNWDDLWTATWRMAVATLALGLFLPMFQMRPATVGQDPRFWRYILPAMFLGTYCGMWLQQAAFSRADTGYVQTLLSTVPIWMLPIALLMGERVSWRAAVGSLVGFSGVILLVFSSR